MRIMPGVFGEFALLLLMSAAAGALLWLLPPVLIAHIVIGIVAGPVVLGVVTAYDPSISLPRSVPDKASNRDLLRGLRELHSTRKVALVASEEFDGAALKRLGRPTLLYSMRSAVDYTVEACNAIIRGGGAAS